jgi:cytochrome c553
MKIYLAILFLVHLTHAADSGDVAQGKNKSNACVACHGVEGLSPNPLWPNLVGQKDEYTIKQLHDFRDGIRVDPIMSGYAKSLSDQDIKDLAAYFGKVK